MKVIQPIINGLRSAFNSVRDSLASNNQELQPFFGFMKAIRERRDGNKARMSISGEARNAIFQMTEDDDTIVFHPHRTDGFRIQGDTVNTLTAFMGTGGLNTPMVSTSKVRRLTPVECERLQGFPDGWTAVDEKTADSHRYKQMGNAVTVNVLTWVGSRID